MVGVYASDFGQDWKDLAFSGVLAVDGANR